MHMVWLALGETTPCHTPSGWVLLHAQSLDTNIGSTGYDGEWRGEEVWSCDGDDDFRI